MTKIQKKGSPPPTNKVNSSNLSKLEALENYLKKRFITKQCELTGFIYYKFAENPEMDWKILARVETMLYEVRKNVKYNTSRGLSGDYCKQYLLELLFSDAFSFVFNPIKAYFEALEWTKKTTCPFVKFVDLLDLEEDNPTERLFVINSIKKWAISAVRSVYEPGYVNKQIFILRSTGENKGKTSFLANLVPKALENNYTLFTSIEGRDKDATIALATNFMGLFEEINDMLSTKPNRSNFKAFVSYPFINVRRPYGRHAERSPRLASFVGTCNDFEFLGDSVGLSRFIIINTKALKNQHYKEDNPSYLGPLAEDFDMNEFWAKAYFLYKSGETGAFSAEEMRTIMARNQMHKFVNPAEAVLLNNFKQSSRDCGEFLTTTAILKELQSDESFAPISSQKMGRILNSAGFVKSKKSVNGASIYGYWVERIMHVPPPQVTDF